MSKVRVEYQTMSDIREYRTIRQAANDERVPYKEYWLRRLCQRGTIKAEKIGTGQRAQWLIHMPTLLAYIEEMDELGTKKHHPD